MAVRVYRAPVRPASRQTPGPSESPAPAPRTQSKRPGARSFAAPIDSFEEPQADSHIVERKAQKESRAGRREFEAARKQQRELREDDVHEG